MADPSNPLASRVWETRDRQPLFYRQNQRKLDYELQKKQTSRENAMRENEANQRRANLDMPTHQARGKKIEEMLAKMADYSPEKLQN